jgi:hypothetical protein
LEFLDVVCTLSGVYIKTSMKRSITLSALLILTLPYLKCQENNIEILKADSLKKGIYLTFEEFQHNNPSCLVNFGIMDQGEIKNKIYNGSSVHNLYIQDTSKSFKIIDKEHWGICDGKNVYILYYRNYYQLSLDGKYCQFSETTSDIIAPTEMNFNFILNASDNKIKRFTKENLIAILKSENKELYDEFKDEKDKELMKYDYLFRLNKLLDKN